MSTLKIVLDSYLQKFNEIFDESCKKNKLQCEEMRNKIINIFSNLDLNKESTHISDYQNEEIRKLVSENKKLKRENEHLMNKLSSMQINNSESFIKNKKILIVLVSNSKSDLSKLRLSNIFDRVIVPLRLYQNNVQICTLTNHKYKIKNEGFNDEIINYQYKKPQLMKICDLFEQINFDDYDWYIKINFDTYFHENFDTKKLQECSEYAINCRCRDYEGPSVNIKNALSVDPNKYKVKIKLNNNSTIINPDDNFYVFHKNIAKQAFSTLNLNIYLEYVIKLNDNFKTWGEKWMLNKQYFIDNIEHERQGHHKFIWYSRNTNINPISINISNGIFKSSNLACE